LSTPALLPHARPSTARSQVVVFDPNVRLLEYIRENLGDTYNLHLFSEKPSLWRELTSDRKPDMLLFSWESADESLILLQQIMGQAGSVPVLVLACTPDTHEMRFMMNMGVRAVILKPFDKQDLEQVIEKHLRPAGPEAPFLMSPQKDVEIPLGDDRYFVRASPAMRALEQQAKVIGASDIPVLVLGESGTGKEVLALFLHKSSSRSKQTFLKVNCAAMPADLLESELFGYEQGAFTGAAKAKPGKFEICNGGTIFLDEIGEMPASLQAKLLHVLQDGTFTRLGGKTPQKVDVRVIAATNINMKQSIAQKSFREDLYYRLNGFSLVLPPLRERREEIQLLADYFMRRAAAKYNRSTLPFTQRMMQAMTEYSWPGNLRELENIVSRYLILGDELSIMSELQAVVSSAHPPVATLTQIIEAPRTRPDATAGEGLKSLVKSLKGDAEALAILEALEANRWNRKAAAKNLQISYKALLYKIKNYNLGATK
jgi:two-component system response regulator AtoC